MSSGIFLATSSRAAVFPDSARCLPDRVSAHRRPPGQPCRAWIPCCLARTGTTAPVLFAYSRLPLPGNFHGINSRGTFAWIEPAHGSRRMRRCRTAGWRPIVSRLQPGLRLALMSAKHRRPFLREGADRLPVIGGVLATQVTMDFAVQGVIEGQVRFSFRLSLMNPYVVVGPLARARTKAADSASNSASG